MSADSPQMDKGNEKPGAKPAPGYSKEFGPYVTLGIQLAAAVIVFYLIGSWLDRRYSTEPAFTLGGIMLGTLGGLVKFFKAVIELNKESESSKDRQQP